MRLIAAAIIGLCIAGAALAQEAIDQAPPPNDAEAAERFFPTWEPLEEGSVRRVYPDRALQRGMAGITHLCCTPQPDRTLACDVAIEWPENYGFGRSARRFIEPRILTTESFTALQARSDARVHVAFRYELLPTPPRLDQVADQIRAQADNLCGPASGPAPDYIRITGQRLR